MSWYVAQTVTTKEIKASNDASKLADVYCPVTWQGKTKKQHAKLVAFLPGYFFIRLEPGKHDFAEVKKIPNIMNIVRMGGDYAPVPDFAIEALKGMQDPSGVIRTRYDHYTDGEQVRFKDNHRFALQQGIIQVDKKHRIYVILEICGKPQKIKAKPVDIEPIN